MSDNLKIQNFKIIITEKFCQKIKVCYFCYIICERHLEDNSGCFSCIENVRPSKLWCFEQPSPLSLVFGCKHTTQNFSEIKFINKKYFFSLWRKHLSYNFYFYEKMFIIEFSYNFLYVWNCMKRNFLFMRIV